MLFGRCAIRRTSPKHRIITFPEFNLLFGRCNFFTFCASLPQIALLGEVHDVVQPPDGRGQQLHQPRPLLRDRHPVQSHTPRHTSLEKAAAAEKVNFVTAVHDDQSG